MRAFSGPLAHGQKLKAGTVSWVVASAAFDGDYSWNQNCYQALFMTTGVQSQDTRETPVPSGVTQTTAIIFWIEAATVVGLISVLFAKVLLDMFNDWWTVPAYSQGILLPPLALYIAWLGRRTTLACPAAVDRRGLLLTSFGCLTFVFGAIGSEFFMMRISFVVLIVGIVWTFWGIPRLRTLMFPLLLLATMVPLPGMVYNGLAAPLQLLASDIAARVAQAFGVSVFRDGNILQLAGTSLGVAEACSGLNSLSALIVGSLLIGYLCCQRFLSRAVLFLLAAPLAIAVNILRVAGTAVLADWNQELALGFYHLFSGWLTFIFGFALLYAAGHILHITMEGH